jgi:hypothetical protein
MEVNAKVTNYMFPGVDVKRIYNLYSQTSFPISLIPLCTLVVSLSNFMGNYRLLIPLYNRDYSSMHTNTYIQGRW